MVTNSYRSYAKINIFLKIIGVKNGLHLIKSRFVKVTNLYDTISLEENDKKGFCLEGKFDCAKKQNTIYKTYQKLCHIDKKVEQFYQKYKIVVDKKIPSFAGLGGSSSNAAIFLKLTNQLCHLNLSIKQMVDIGKQIGADVPFFIYEFDSANVSGFGEIVEFFDEPKIDIEIFTPNIKCSTKEVYEAYDSYFYNKNSPKDFDNITNTPTIKLLENYSAVELNDLFLPAIKLKKQLYDFKDGWFFTGSGSSFFRIKR